MLAKGGARSDKAATGAGEAGRAGRGAKANENADDCELERYADREREAAKRQGDFTRVLSTGQALIFSQNTDG